VHSVRQWRECKEIELYKERELNCTKKRNWTVQRKGIELYKERELNCTKKKNWTVQRKGIELYKVRGLNCTKKGNGTVQRKGIELYTEREWNCTKKGNGTVQRKGIELYKERELNCIKNLFLIISVTKCITEFFLHYITHSRYNDICYGNIITKETNDRINIFSKAIFVYWQTHESTNAKKHYLPIFSILCYLFIYLLKAFVLHFVSVVIKICINFDYTYTLSLFPLRFNYFIFSLTFFPSTVSLGLLSRFLFFQILFHERRTFCKFDVYKQTRVVTNVNCNEY